MEKEPRVKVYRKDDFGTLRYFTIPLSELKNEQKED
jgi:hypothetical protein